MIEGPDGVGHGIRDAACDAACDADHLRAFIADDPGATAQIEPTPSRSASRGLAWMLDKARHLVECFFNTLKRFRRIALRCENPLSSFKGFVDRACAMAWIN